MEAFEENNFRKEIMMYLLAMLSLTFSLFLPYTPKTGTDVYVLVNSPCGPIPMESFVLEFIPGEYIIGGMTDEQGRAHIFCPTAVYVDYQDDRIWMRKYVENNMVAFQSWYDECPFEDTNASPSD